MHHLYLCRHGETPWNAERRIQGRTDISLSQKGLAQAQALARFFGTDKPNARVIVSSPMMRARQTAECIARATGIELVIDDDLTEIHTGIYTGRTYEELADDPGWQRHLEDPWHEGYGEGGECAESVRDRVVRCLGKYEDAIWVSHASPIRHILMYLLDIPSQHLYHIAIENAAATYLTFRNGHVKLRYLNRV